MFISNVQDLVDALRTRNPAAQLFLMTQRKNPRENVLLGVVGREQMPDQQGRLENGIRSDDVFLVVGRQLRAGCLSAWTIAENQPASVQRDPQSVTMWQIKLAEIAQQHLDVETLNVRGSRELDYHSLHVASLRAALTAAYRAGVTAGIYCVVEPENADVPDEPEPGAGGDPDTADHDPVSGADAPDSDAATTGTVDIAATDAPNAAPSEPVEPTAR